MKITDLLKPVSIQLNVAPPKSKTEAIEILADLMENMISNNEKVPVPLSEKKYSGRFAVRVPSMVHQKLALEAAERGVSMNRLVSAKLAM